MTIRYIRLLFVVVSAALGIYLGDNISAGGGTEYGGIIGGIAGVCGAILVIACENAVKRISLKGLSAAVFGLLFGLVISMLIREAFRLTHLPQSVATPVRIGVTMLFCYLGMIIALRGREEFNLVIPYVRFTSEGSTNEMAILDTSVIIDGRIADICKTNFICGKLIIPRFVLQELQLIADSHDALKRNRGRRGLDVLNMIQKNSAVDVRIHEMDFPEVAEVDAKLVKLGKILNAKVITNDFNLNKVAELQGVPVLNINELANALKPVVLPGESMSIKLVKAGKEYNQGVGYLDDGTMVVVENSREKLGQTLDVTVSSVLQTQAGKMIFAKLPGKENSRR